jgi:hypothetical protein
VNVARPHPFTNRYTAADESKGVGLDANASVEEENEFPARIAHAAAASRQSPAVRLTEDPRRYAAVNGSNGNVATVVGRPVVDDDELGGQAALLDSGEECVDRRREVRALVEDGHDHAEIGRSQRRDPRRRAALGCAGGTPRRRGCCVAPQRSPALSRVPQRVLVVRVRAGVYLSEASLPARRRTSDAHRCHLTATRASL